MRRVLASVAILGAALAGCSAPADPPAPAEPSGATDTPSSTITPGPAKCKLSKDGKSFVMSVTNDGNTTTSYIGDVVILGGTEELAEINMQTRFVHPDEVVAESALTGIFDGSATSCDAAAVQPVEEKPLAVGTADVSKCLNVQKAENGTYSYQLKVKNSSTELAATYSIEVALRDSDGARIATRRVLAAWETGDWTAVKPGASVTQYDEALSVPFAKGISCEVVSVEKGTEGDFFTADAQGVQRGSISADVAFASGGAKLTKDGRVLLQSAIKPLKAATTPVCVAGFADSVGKTKANLKLSGQRAESVAKYLKSAGVTADLQTVGKGESEATQDDQSDPELRRVDITLAACA